MSLIEELVKLAEEEFGLFMEYEKVNSQQFFIKEKHETEYNWVVVFSVDHFIKDLKGYLMRNNNMLDMRRVKENHTGSPILKILMNMRGVDPLALITEGKYRLIIQSRSMKLMMLETEGAWVQAYDRDIERGLLSKYTLKKNNGDTKAPIKITESAKTSNPMEDFINDQVIIPINKHTLSFARKLAVVNDQILVEEVNINNPYASMTKYKFGRDHQGIITLEKEEMERDPLIIRLRDRETLEITPNMTPEEIEWLSSLPELDTQPLYRGKNFYVSHTKYYYIRLGGGWISVTPSSIMLDTFPEEVQQEINIWKALGEY